MPHPCADQPLLSLPTQQQPPQQQPQPNHAATSRLDELAAQMTHLQQSPSSPPRLAPAPVPCGPAVAQLDIGPAVVDVKDQDPPRRATHGDF
jgi:hypothetical protein